MNKFHFIVGFIRNLFNPKISSFAFVSSNNNLDKTVCVYRGAKIKNSMIRSYTYVGNNTDISNAVIGKFCSIADYCRIGMGGHSLSHISTSPIFIEKVNGCQETWTERDLNPVKSKRVFIGNDVWIGSHVLINGGVTVGNGAVIGAGSVVVKDVPPYAIVGGVPAKVIRFRFNQEIIDRLEQISWWNYSTSELKDMIHIFQTDSVDMSLCEQLVNNK